MPANTLFSWSAGALDLVRFPVPRDYSLQAFDAADAYVLNYLAENGQPITSPWVINDHFGALTLGLEQYNPLWIGSSWSARHAMQENASRNGIGSIDTAWISDSDGHRAPGVVVMQLPKENDVLEFQLQWINRHAPAGIPLVAGGMTRNIHSSTIKLFEHYAEDVKSSLAWKKARLILGRTKAGNHSWKTLRTMYVDPRSGASVVSLPGVFSADHPDPGSSLLAHAIPSLPEGINLIDIGCGNGYLLAVIGLKNPSIRLVGTDDSILAIDSTRETLEMNRLAAALHHGHATADVEPSSVDVAVCNPPFHQGHTRHDQIAWDMFSGAKRVLRPQGTLYVVGNRNLGYHIPLSRLYKNVEVLASDKTYTVFSCRL